MRPELALVGLMIVIVAMLIVPLPTWLIDGLIALNIVAASLVFVGAFHLRAITAFSSFPALLLVTTVFRLALSITTSRMILMQADAGHIVASFGDFVIGGDLVIGVTMFAILTVVQFMVITKGTERVAEVCARFSLDGLPGKQMSIDADLRSNLINGEQAREQRRLLERESQLYGSLDGAVKFVKGDALASILIIFVNFLGGLAMGQLRHGLSFNEALDTYTRLTIGDGLVAQVPALLISIATGLVVTRVNGDENNLGATLIAQVAREERVLLIAAGIALLIGLLPGFPLAVFVILSMALVAVCVQRRGGVRHWRALFSAEGQRLAAGAQDGTAAGGGAVDAGSRGTSRASEVVALALLVPADALPWCERNEIATRLARDTYHRLGLRLPTIVVRAHRELPSNRFAVLVNEVRAGYLRIVPDGSRVVEGVDLLQGVGAALIDLSEPGDACFWLAADQTSRFAQLDVQWRSAADELAERFATVVARHVAELFGIQETRDLLDEIESRFPELVKETVRNAPLQRITNVLQRLVAERIPVRNLKLVLEAIAQWAPRERDNVMLAEHVRSSLGRYITERFSRGQHLDVLLLSPAHEEIVRRAIQQTSTGSFLNLPPNDAQTLCDAVSARLAALQVGVEDVLMLSSPDVRRFVKKALETQFPRLDVISYAEITDQSRINVLQTV